MINKPKVSVIIPIYNVENYLKECIESVINQTLKEIEIILVDDESPDNCPMICDEYSKLDDRIIVIHKKNEGLGLARNSGLDVASGEYVYFVDSDDYLFLNALEKLYFTANQVSCDICLGNICYVKEHGFIEKNINIYSGKEYKPPLIVNNVLLSMLGAAPKAKKDVELEMSVWQGLYKLSWLKDNKLRFSSERIYLSEDIVFHLEALPKANVMRFIPDYVYYHRLTNQTSLTNYYDQNRFSKISFLYIEEINRVREYTVSDEMIKRIQRTYLGNIRVCLKQIVRESKCIKDRNFALNEIKKIVADKTIQKVLDEYPYKKNPVKQAVMSFLLKHKLIYMIYLATLVQNGDLI